MDRRASKEVFRRAMIRVKGTGSSYRIYGVKKYTHREGMKRMQREEIDPKEEEIEERKEGKKREKKEVPIIYRYIVLTSLFFPLW